MKSGGVVAVVVVLAAVLLLVLRGRQTDEETVAVRSGSGASAGGDRLGSARPGGQRGETTSGSGLRESRRRELPPAAGSGGAGGAANGASGAMAAGVAGGITGNRREAAALGAPGGAAGDDVAQMRGPDVTRRDAPDAGSTGPVVDYDAEGNIQEPIPEVAFESAEDRFFPTDSQEEVQDAGPIGGGSGTVAFWVKPEWGEGSQEDATLVQLGDSGLEITKNVNFLRFQYQDSAGVENGLGSNLSGWTPNEWRLVTATWAGNQLTLYVDGVMVSQNSFAHPPEFQDETKLYVGSSFPSGAPAAPASIGSLKVFNRNWSQAEVNDLFRAGPPKTR